MNIEQYQESDFNDLARLYMDFFNEMREWQGLKKLRVEEKEVRKIAKESLDENSRVFVAKDSGKPVGFARVQLWDGAHFLREVFVGKPFRRSGVGSRLLTKCEHFVQKKGETSIFLTVEPKHSASLKFLIHNSYDTLNMLELRKDFVQTDNLERQGQLEILGHRLHLLKRESRAC